MLLIAGLFGIVASGLLLIETPQTDADPEDAPDTPEDPLAENEEGTTSSPLSEAVAEVADRVPEQESLDQTQASPSPAALSDGPTAQDADDRDFWTEETALVLKDQVAGAHLSDSFGGSVGPAILHTEDATFGHGGDDSLRGGAGDDLLIGNDGNDQLRGGTGRDGLYGGTGDDALWGGDGDDILHGEDGDDLLGGDGGDDLLLGGDGDDTLSGGQGNDRLFGGFGKDVIHGGSGDDLLDGTEMEEGDTLDADAGDELLGGEGNDTLAGGQQDTLTGGEGRDMFLFRAPSAGAFGSDLAPLSSAFVPLWIADFDAEEDALEILYDPAEQPDPDNPPRISVIEAAGAIDLVLNGAVVAKLSAGTIIDADSIRLVADS
ncbi:calcium-binding protein [Jannaschia sp. 2305UL9-9]|uniref:calcium-binding protein n=1 Tax=Jannaschia sp. 2305UL9-9 TaxID=3121638 RepID=UPI0035274FBA